MLPYTMALHHEFAHDHDGDLAALREQYRFAFRDPVSGEQFVLRSFSTEWLVAPDSFDRIYSRGALHHMYSTEDAFRALARYCAPGGALYLWVYGPNSINDSAFRRGVYVAERLARVDLC